MSIDSHSRAAGVSLRSILANVKPTSCSDFLVRGCSGAWDECQPGDLFVAIDNGEGDGHDHVHLAIEKGASAVLCERLLAVSIPQFVVDDTRQAFGHICHAVAGQPSQQILSVAVAGSDGKSGSANYIQSVLHGSGLKTARLSNPDFHGENKSMDRDTPLCAAALSLWINEKNRNDCQAVVIETSSRTLAQHTFTGTRFDYAVVTNVRSDNAPQHGGTKNYRRLQLRPLELLKPGGVAIINADDPWLNQILHGIESAVLTFGIRQDADVTAKVVERDANGQTICLKAGSDTALVRLPTPGQQAIYDCLAAVAVGLSESMELIDIATAIESTPSLPGRMERVDCGQDFSLWIDSAVRPSQVATAIHSVRQVCTGRLLVAITMHPDQSPEQRRRIGEILKRKASSIVITQPDCAMIQDYEPAHQILDGVENHDSIRLIPNRMDAIEWLLSESRAGDSILLLGAGDRPIAIVGDQQWPVTDKDLVQAWLYDRNQQESLSPIEGIERIYRMQDYRQN